MKKNKTIKNILFIIFVIIFVLCIAFFNYKMDPYNIFEKKDYMDLSDIPREMIYIIMKGYKNDKSDTIVIGGSETGCLFDKYFQNYFNNISVREISFEQYKELLDAYIKLHPETKKVIIFPSYISMIWSSNNTFPKFKKTNYTLKEYQRILLSSNVTKESLIIFKNIIKKNIKNNKEIFNISYLPKYIDRYGYPYEQLKELEKNNFKNIKDIIKLLEKKNIDYIFVIPPYHATLMSVIYKNQEESQENIDNFRRFLVSVVPEDKKIYDFAFINEYTTSDLDTNKNGLYVNSSHPSIIFGSKIFKIIYNIENSKNNIYFLLNKDNVEDIIIKEKRLLDEYINKNKKIFEYYNKLYYTENREDLLQTKIIYLDSLSKDAQNEYKFLEKIKNERK